MPELEDEDYKDMWKKLRDELHDLLREGADYVYPGVMLGYMSYIEQAAEYQGVIRLLQAKLKIAGVS